MTEPRSAVGAPFADAVIVAAGSSTRMGGIDKLFERLDGATVLERSVAALAAAASVGRVIVVARPDKLNEVAALPGLAASQVVAGGAERTDSVRAGVSASGAEVVLVHDAARPLASPALADAVALAAAEHGAAVPVVPVVDSLKRAADGRVEQSLDRSGLVRAQTPQGARRELLLAALAATAGQAFSDEAALLESQGVPVAVVTGEMTNLKLTEPADFVLARAIVRGNDEQGTDERLGFGQDTHGFGPGDGLWLGGVLVESAPRLYGHSDGDVVLHALATAVLSAAGLGDLGRLFPASDASTTGIASSELLLEAVARVAAQRWSVASAQVSLVGARPRLGTGRIEAMRLRVAELLSAPTAHVSIVASTGNLAGDEGAGRVISATALVRLHRR